MPALRILLVCSSYPPVIGGSEVEAQRVCAALRARGHQVRVITTGGPPMPPGREFTDPFGTPVDLLGGNGPEPGRSRRFALYTPLAIWRRRDYDLVYFLMTGLHVTLGVTVCALLGLPVFMKFSGSNTIRPLLGSRLGRLQLSLLHRHARKVMILNPAMREEAIECGFDPQRLEWMPNPVDVETFRPLAPEARLALRERLGIPPAAEVIVFVGRLAPEKALPSLIDAFHQVAVERPQAWLLLVGDGPEKDKLLAQARGGAGAGRIRFVGAVSPERIPHWLQSADIFALVSELEGFPCSLVEAQACALPAVVSDIPANVQLVRAGQQGCVAPLRDAAALARAMVELLSDSEGRRRMGDNGRSQVVERFSLSQIAERYERIFSTGENL